MSCFLLFPIFVCPFPFMIEIMIFLFRIESDWFFDWVSAAFVLSSIRDRIKGTFSTCWTVCFVLKIQWNLTWVLACVSMVLTSFVVAGQCELIFTRDNVSRNEHKNCNTNKSKTHSIQFAAFLLFVCFIYKFFLCCVFSLFDLLAKRVSR